MIVLLLAGLLHPLPQYDYNYFQFCTESLGRDFQSCCDNSGGIVVNGDCTDAPAVPYPGPTVTVTVRP